MPHDDSADSKKRYFNRRSFFSHQDEESIEIMTPRQMTYRLNATKSVIHIFTFKTHTHPHRKMERQMNVLADHAAVFTCIKGFNTALNIGKN